MRRVFVQKVYAESCMRAGKWRKGAGKMKTKVKEMRTEKGMTQQQLADLVHVSSRTIISIEKGHYNPSLLLAYRMAKVFETSIEDLCCLEENEWGK